MATDGAPPRQGLAAAPSMTGGAGYPSASPLWQTCFGGEGAWRPGGARGDAGARAGHRVTMVIDKGTPLGYFLDLLDVAAPHMRFWKLAFGSALLYEPEQVRARVERARQRGVEVYAGGTLLEIARTMGDAGATLEQMARLGLRWVEISDGTFPLTADRRAALIGQALDRGFAVITEVGSKDPSHRFMPEAAAAQVEADLDAGACFVLVEARDSGQGIGVYDPQGRLDRRVWQALWERLSRPDRVIWEAPRAEQQRELLSLLGPDVNLGNVQVGDVLTLASMRWGLRSDTIRVWTAGRDGSTGDGQAGRRRVDGALRQG